MFGLKTTSFGETRASKEICGAVVFVDRYLPAKICFRMLFISLIERSVYMYIKESSYLWIRLIAAYFCRPFERGRRTKLVF